MRIAATYSTAPPNRGRIDAVSIEIAAVDVAAFDAALDQELERHYPPRPASVPIVDSQSFVVDALSDPSHRPPRPAVPQFLLRLAFLLEVDGSTLVRRYQPEDFGSGVAGARRYGIDRIGGARAGDAVVIVGLSYDRPLPTDARSVALRRILR